MQIHADKKLVFVRNTEVRVLRTSNAAKMSKYRSPEMLAHSFMARLCEKFKKFGMTDPDESDIYDTKVLHSRNPRCSSTGMNAARNEDISNLFKQRAFKFMPREEKPADGNVLPGCFFLSSNASEVELTKYKASCVAG